MKTIKGYENYLINEQGQIYSLNRKRFKKPFISNQGYEVIGLFKDGKHKKFSIHYLVLSTFIGERPTEKHQGMHIDGNKRNNTLINLKWGTCRDNHMDKKNHGTFQEAENHGMSKLNAEKVKLIRSNPMPHVYYAKLFNVTPEAINYAKNKGWKSI